MLLQLRKGVSSTVKLLNLRSSEGTNEWGMEKQRADHSAAGLTKWKVLRCFVLSHVKLPREVNASYPIQSFWYCFTRLLSNYSKIELLVSSKVLFL